MRVFAIVDYKNNIVVWNSSGCFSCPPKPLIFQNAGTAQQCLDQDLNNEDGFSIKEVEIIEFWPF
jgi:hypothetical protein